MALVIPWPRMTELERQIVAVAIGGLVLAVAVGAAVGYAIDELVHRDR